MDQDKIKLQKVLDLLNANYNFPCPFLFKFIVPKEKLVDLELLFPGKQLSTRPSSKGKYLSVSVTEVMADARDVLQRYDQASTIDGLIAI